MFNMFNKGGKQHPLPIGKAEYEAWSKRIIEGAKIPGLTEDSANFALTSMLLHLPSTQSFHTDAFFVHGLRKSAVNETAYAIMKELEARLKARRAAEAPPPQPTSATPPLKLVESLPETTKTP